MRKSITFFIGFLVMVSCADRLVEKPDNPISEDQMVSILKDMAVINAAKSTNFNILKEHGIEPTEYIFEKYAIDSVTFVQNDRYYASRPVEYLRIHEAVEALLLKEKEEADVRKKVNDSLNMISRQKQKANDSTKIVSKIRAARQ